MKNNQLLDQLSYRLNRNGRVGVIDIGSNSIRLVIYDGMKRVPQPIYNEKAFCSLGQGMSKNNRLHPEGVKMARSAIARLLATARINKVSELHVIATAAVRDADDGKAFVKELERTHKISIDIISGKREAKYAAMGIASGHYNPQGIVADLGGGSLELTILENQTVIHHNSQPMGALRLLDRSKGSSELLDELINRYLNEIDWLANISGEYSKLYAVGGSFRALAKTYMQRINYPLSFLHNYTLPVSDMRPMLEEIALYDEEKVKILPVSSERQLQMPAAARVLLALIDRGQIDTLVFSTSGIREGLLFSMLSPYLRQDDLLLASCDILRQDYPGQIRYSRELCEWMTPLFEKEDPSLMRVRVATCMLNHLALNIQTNSRATWAYHHILQASIRGLQHSERVAMGAALYHRYKFSFTDDFGSYQLLDDKWKSWAALVGTAMRLGYMLSGGSPGNLAKTQIRIEQDRPQLRLTGDMKAMQGCTLDKRKESLNAAYVEFLRHHL